MMMITTTTTTFVSFKTLCIIILSILFLKS